MHPDAVIPRIAQTQLHSPMPPGRTTEEAPQRIQHRAAMTKARATLVATSLLAATLLLGVLGWTAPVAAELRPTPREGAEHAVPLYGQVLRPYDAPDDPFAPGHRGIDVAAPAGTKVRASAGGTVAFAGSVAGNRSVTVEHDANLKTTYSFLDEILVARGASVSLGTVVGTVGSGHPGGDPRPHVHLSARRDGVYFDPLELYVGSSYADLIAITR